MGRLLNTAQSEEKSLVDHSMGCISRWTNPLRMTDEVYANRIFERPVCPFTRRKCLSVL
jgi:hypothetical protein